MADSPKPTHVSEILETVVEGRKWPQDVRGAIRAGVLQKIHPPHPGCPCIDCHRAFRTVP